jgi:hypothetical protein
MGGAGQVGYGPLERIDGPPPLRPLYGLVQVAEASAAGVRIVVDEQAGPGDLGVAPGILEPLAGQQRWLNGVEVYPYPPDVPDVYDPCAQGTWSVAKGFGTTLKHPTFGAMTVHIDETCTAIRVPSQEDYKARAVASLVATESAAVAKELMGGAKMPLNPHYADGNGAFPNGNAATSILHGIALLEDEIAKSGRAGLIHITPGLATIARDRWAISLDGGLLRTVTGTIVVPDCGYQGSAQPGSRPAPSGTKEWIFATGPIDLRRGEIFVTPETVAEALDRGVGATNSTPNSITYRAERYYLATWDTHVQAAVLVDRCFTTCTS